MSKEEELVAQLKIIDVSGIVDIFETHPAILNFLKEEDKNAAIKKAVDDALSSVSPASTDLVAGNLLTLQTMSAIQTNSKLQKADLEKQVNDFLGYLAEKGYPLDSVKISGYFALIVYKMPLKDLKKDIGKVK